MAWARLKAGEKMMWGVTANEVYCCWCTCHGQIFLAGVFGIHHNVSHGLYASFAAYISKA